MAVGWGGLVLRDVMELATTGALAAGVWEAIRGARAKVRAREIAETQLRRPGDDSAIDKEMIDKLLLRLSSADRARVVEALKQRNPAAAKRYLIDIFPKTAAQAE